MTDVNTARWSADEPGAAHGHVITRCLIVDDHEVVRAGTIAHLERVAWIEVVGEAGGIRTAIDVLCASRPDVALVDLRLPDGDGATIAHAVRDRDLDTRIVFYSAEAPRAVVHRVLAMGASGFVLKGSPFDVVVDALAAARDRQRYIDPAVAADLLGGQAGHVELSPREQEILPMIAAGAQNAAIAHDLSISAETVKAHVSNILVKLDASNRTEAVVKAMRSGLIR